MNKRYTTWVDSLAWLTIIEGRKFSAMLFLAGVFTFWALSPSTAKVTVNDTQHKVTWAVGYFFDDAQSASRGFPGCSGVATTDRQTYARSLDICAPGDDSPTCDTRTTLFAAGYVCEATVARNVCSQAAADDVLALCPQGQVGVSGTPKSNLYCAQLGLAFGICTLNGDAATCEKDAVALGWFPSPTATDINDIADGADCVQERLKKIVSDWRNAGRATMRNTALPAIDTSGSDDED